MPGTTCATQNATCSVSAKKLSGLRSSTILPTGVSGTSSSGTSFVASRTSKLKASACSSVKSWKESSHSGYAPASMASQRSRRWKSASAPAIFTASSQSSACVPATGRQWNFTKVAFPSASTSRYVCTPKPCIMRRLRGRARSDMTHISMWADSGMSDTKSQKVSCAVAACGMPECGSGLAAWIRSGNFIASWMKKTGMLLPTRSQLPSSV